MRILKMHFIFAMVLVMFPFIGNVASANLEESLVAYYPFDWNANDESGNGNHGTVHGASWATGIIGGALDFDGIDDYVIVSDDDTLDLSDGLTIAAWIQSYSNSWGRVIVSKWNDNSGDHSYHLKDTNNSDKLQIVLTEHNFNDLADLKSESGIPLGDWIHIASTFDGSMTKLYFNGVEDASQVSVGTIRASVTDMLIGAVFTGGGIRENFDGLIDEVRIYNRALSEPELMTLVPEPTSFLLLGFGSFTLLKRRMK